MSSEVDDTPLARAAIRLAAWFEHWFPDAFSFAILTVAVVYLLGCAIGNPPMKMALFFGEGFWKLIEFTMQMVMIIVSGYALATAPPIHRVIVRMASVPKTPRGAVAYIALFSMLSSLLSWSFSLIFSGLLAREVAHRVKGTDYRAAGAAAYMGLGSVWALGLSSSAAILMATNAPARADLFKVSGIIPYSETIFSWQSMVMAVVLIIASMIVAYVSAPRPENARDAESLGVSIAEAEAPREEAATPAERMDRHPVLTLCIVLVGGLYMIDVLRAGGPGALTELPNYILLFLLLGLLLHWSPKSFTQAVVKSAPACAGVLLQYPLYAGAARMITESGISHHLSEFFVAHSTHSTFPLLVGVYSAVLGLFVPSAGGKWLIEAPYLMGAANQLQCNLGWVVQTYNAAEALPNLIHPFWMLPLLGILHLRARDIVGYSAVQFIVHVPLVMLLVWALNLTMPYIPPIPPPS
ncbi:MAG: short-chain fatty acid transporter [Armatimonadetes bacterium]|nr:short-chain fatty acid transporter [Armatimonadota bacterium]